MDKTALYSFMAGERYAVLSSVAEDGSPQSALIGIAVTEKLEVIFDTVKSSRKYANLKRRHECSLVLGLGGSSGDKTVQLEGVAEELGGEGRNPYLEVYFTAWPDGLARLSWPGLVHFVVHPRWIRSSDFGQSPPVIEEFRLLG
jgi:pyridoxine/pyridoxamine 5'-phosphate oxidase